MHLSIRLKFSCYQKLYSPSITLHLNPEPNFKPKPKPSP